MPETEPSDRRSTSLGFWVGWLTSAAAAVALVVAVTTLPRSGPYCRAGCLSYPYTDAGAFVPRDYLWLYPALVVTVLAVVLAGYLQDRVPPRRRVQSRVGAMFVAIAAGLLLVDYVVQLTVLQPALVNGQTEGLSAWTQYHPYGLFIALENTGYATLNIGFGFLGYALVGAACRSERAAGWVFLAGAAATAAALLYVASRYGAGLDYRFEVAAIMFSWLALIIAPGLLARAGKVKPARLVPALPGSEPLHPRKDS